MVSDEALQLIMAYAKKKWSCQSCEQHLGLPVGEGKWKLFQSSVQCQCAAMCSYSHPPCSIYREVFYATRVVVQPIRQVALDGVVVMGDRDDVELTAGAEWKRHRTCMSDDTRLRASSTVLLYYAHATARPCECEALARVIIRLDCGKVGG